MLSFQASISKGWLHREAGFRFGESYYLDPVFRLNQDREMHIWIAHRFPDVPIYNMEDNLVQAQYVQKNQVLVGGIQPNLILGAILGSEIRYYDDKDADLSGTPLKDTQDITHLPEADEILDHPLVLSLDAQVRQLTKTYSPDPVIPPFFWDVSGRATIHGIITTSLKLLGDQALMLPMTDPERLQSFHRWITDCYTLLIRHYAALTDFTITSVHVGECSGSMLSGDLYSQFVVPYISELGGSFKAVRIHSCGQSDHILGAISQIRNLAVVDTGSGTSIEMIRELMGNELEINVSPPVELLLSGKPGRMVLDWLHAVLAQNGGGPLKIPVHLDVGYDVANCLSIYYELAGMDLIKTGRSY